MNVIWSETAKADLRHIRDYIAKQNPGAARSTAQSIIEAGESLVGLSNRGRPGRTPETRELLVRGIPYFLSYRITALGVEILAVIHFSRHWPPV